MKKKSLFRLLPFIIVLVALAVTNVYEDPSNIFHDVGDNVAQAISSGHEVYISSSNLNEREVKSCLIERMPDKVDCVAIGPSLIMCVNSDIVNDGTFVNLGVSGGGLYSMLEQLGMLEKFGKKTDRIIICADSYIFDEQVSPPNMFEGKFRDYSSHMVSMINHEESAWPEQDENGLNLEKIEQAFSITYFQGAQNQIVKQNQIFLKRPRWGIIEDGMDFSGSFYSADGSWNYGANVTNAGTQDVIRDCQNYDIEEKLAKGRHASAYSLEVFEKLVSYLTEQGIEVELFMCPLAPSLWNRLELNKSEYYMLDEIEELVDQMVEKYNVKVTGSYNPYELGMSDSDFYDARHVRRELLGDYFDFTGK